MATIYVRAANPVWYMVDLTGIGLNDEYYIFFLTNVFPYVPQPVYRDDLGSATWPDPLEFYPNGTLPNNLFFDPAKVYRLEVRHGNSQSDQLIYEINDFVPGSSQPQPEPPSDVFDNSENLISNPQFEVVNFVSDDSDPYTFTEAVSGTYTLNIAPGWDLVLTGTGTTTLLQKNFSGQSNAGVVGDPPYAIHIANSDWTTAVLRQRLERNGAIFSGGTASMYILAYPYTNAQTISLQYVPSTGTSQEIASSTLTAGQFSALSGVINIDASTNTDLGSAAYVDLEVILQPTETIDITNVQFVGTSTNVTASEVTAPIYAELSIERQQDHLAHYYDPYLANKPITNYTLGWNFGMNPCQALGQSVAAVALGANKARYIADQTISFESVSNALSYEFDAANGLVISTTSDSQFAIIQYLGLAEARQILSDHNQFGKICVQINGEALASDINGNITLWYTTNASLPSAPIETNHAVFFASLTDGVPTTITSDWTEVPRADGYGDAKFTFTTTTRNVPFNFSDWDSGIDPTTVTYFAIVIGFDTLVAANSVRLDWCSLCKGKFATQPPAENPAQVLQGLQYYYQKSFKPGVKPAQNVGFGNGETIFIQANAVQGIIPVNFVTPLIAKPIITSYNPAAANAEIRNISTSADYHGTTVAAAQLSSNSFYFIGLVDGGSAAGDIIAINWVSDSRLGQI